MDSALKSAAVGRNSVVIAMAIGLAAQVLKVPIGDDQVKILSDNLADMIALGNMVWAAGAAAWSRYKAKKSAQTAGEPPSLINNSGMSKLDTMTALSILVILAFILVGYGCIKPVMKQDVAERIAVSLSAKALGQKLQGDFKWTPQMDAFVQVIEADGITLSTGQMASNYLMPRIPELYHREARIIFESVGFEFSGDSVVNASRVNKVLLLEAVGAFKEGLTYKKQASVGDMWDVNYPVGPYHGGRLVTYLPDGIEVR